MNRAKFQDRLLYMASSPADFARLLYATASNQWHRGTRSFGPRRVACNLCGWQGRHFDYFRERHHIRRNSQCPGCGSQTRHRELIAFIGKEISVSGKLVLDIAPVPRYRQWFESRGAAYVSIDRGERSAMVRMDMTRMAFAGRRFDLIICSHVLEHISEFGDALAELGRVLKDDGVGLVAVPFSRQAASRPLPEPDHQGHCHAFGRDIVDRIGRAGFRVEVKHYSEARDQDDPANQFFAVTKKPGEW
ncbi:MAG TPA: methyltransferase domain-containing protein [bacterium]|nr:methyltransferase domain-containing protein [bacterium]